MLNILKYIKIKIISIIDYKYISAISFCMPVLMILILSMEQLYKPMVDGEVWYYFALSKNIFTDFFRIKDITQYHFPTSYYLCMGF